MKRNLAALALCLTLLTGCAAGSAPAEPSTEPAAEPVTQPAADFTHYVPDLPDDHSLWTLDDFPALTDLKRGGEGESYKLLEGTREELTVTVLRGEQPGPTVYLVGGVHGDEIAGWKAGNLLKTADIKAGTLYIIAPVNAYGAQEDQRRTKDGWDLNRAFPGDPEGQDAQRIAAAVFADIQEKTPVLVLDLHEARAKEDDYEKLGSNYDALGNSLICHSLDGIGDMVLELLLDSEAGLVCSQPFILYSAPPAGSVNQTVTETLGIPTITVETLRVQPLELRVANQLAVVEYALRWYGLI